MFGISGGEFFVLVIVAALVLGPKNVAQALHALQKGIASVRAWSARLRAETSINPADFGLDPQQIAAMRDFNLRSYDPRQMVREAVQEEMAAWFATTAHSAQVPGSTPPAPSSGSAFPSGSDGALVSDSAPMSAAPAAGVGPTVADWVPSGGSLVEETRRAGQEPEHHSPTS